MQTEKSQPEGKRIMPETRFTEFLALSVDPKVEISCRCLIIFLTYDIKSYDVFSIIFDILRRIMTFSDCHSMLSVVVQK